MAFVGKKEFYIKKTNKFAILFTWYHKFHCMVSLLESESNQPDSNNIPNQSVSKCCCGEA